MNNKVITGLLIIVLIVSLGSLVVSAGLFIKLSQSENQGQTTEDGVIIAGEYEVISTRNISDAYKNGGENTLNDKDRETLDLAQKVLSKVIKEGMSDFDKEKAIFDWMVDSLSQDRGLLTVIPSSNGDSAIPYGVLKYKNGVCVGDAVTFRLFMEMLDIPCKVVHENGLYHTWNLVKIEDDWYHVDVFSSIGNKGYGYFNLTDEMVGQDWDREFFPKATSLKYNMAHMNAVKCKSPVDVPAILRASIDNKDSMCSILFPKSFTEHDASLVSKLVDAIQSYLWDVPELSETYLEGAWYPIDDGYLYVIKNSFNNENSENELNPKEVEELMKAANDAFLDLGGGEIYMDNSYPNESEEAEEKEKGDTEDVAVVKNFNYKAN